MKRLLALLIVLAISVMCLFSCEFIFGNKGDGGDSNPSDGKDDSVIQEDDGDVDSKDNFIIDGWENIIK